MLRGGCQGCRPVSPLEVVFESSLTDDADRILQAFGLDTCSTIPSFLLEFPDDREHFLRLEELRATLGAGDLDYRHSGIGPNDETCAALLWVGVDVPPEPHEQIGRASCRERVCQNV